MADAQVLKTCGGNPVRVRVSPGPQVTQAPGLGHFVKCTLEEKMERLEVELGGDQYFVIYSRHPLLTGKVNITVRQLEHTKQHFRVQVPNTKKSEIRQKLQDQYGADAEISFL